MRKPHLVHRIVFLGILLLFLASCSSKVNEANFEKIKQGMTQQEVNQILGPPTESSGMSFGGLSGSASEWKSKNGDITVQFLNGKVWAKQSSFH
jgi:SmpA / OmlA family